MSIPGSIPSTNNGSSNRPLMGGGGSGFNNLNVSDIIIHTTDRGVSLLTDNIYSLLKLRNQGGKKLQEPVFIAKRLMLRVMKEDPAKDV